MAEDSENTVDYAAPGTRRPQLKVRTQRLISLSPLGLLLLINLILIIVAWWDSSWGAMFIGVFLGPIINCSIFLICFVAAAFLRRLLRDSYFFVYFGLTITVPVFCIMADWFAIGLMNLHGC